MYGLGLFVGFVFFFLLKILILTLTRHTVWNPGLCPLFPGEHPTAKERMLLSLVVRTAAREHDSNYGVKAFGSEDFHDSTSLSVIAGM